MYFRLYSVLFLVIIFVSISFIDAESFKGDYTQQCDQRYIRFDDRRLNLCKYQGPSELIPTDRLLDRFCVMRLRAGRTQITPDETKAIREECAKLLDFRKPEYCKLLDDYCKDKFMKKYQKQSFLGEYTQQCDQRYISMFRQRKNYCKGQGPYDLLPLEGILGRFCFDKKRADRKEITPDEAKAIHQECKKSLDHRKPEFCKLLDDYCKDKYNKKD